MVKLFLILSMMLNQGIGEGKGFQGSLQVVNSTCYDTTLYLLYIKESKIKLNEFDKFGYLINSYLIDLNKNNIYALNPEKKLYSILDVHPFVPNNPDEYEIIKTENFQFINGYKCYQWRVKDKSKNTEIAYWVTKDDFNFYNKMLSILNKSDKTFNFFLLIPNNDGYIPMLTEERTLLRNTKSKVQVIRIERENLNNKIFEIPPDYKLFN